MSRSILNLHQDNFFQKFFHDTLLKFSSFQGLSGFYVQKQGLSMGSQHLPTLSDIFCHVMEEKIILQLMEKSAILHYNKYFDDCILIIEKSMERCIQTARFLIFRFHIPVIAATK